MVPEANAIAVCNDRAKLTAGQLCNDRAKLTAGQLCNDRAKLTAGQLRITLISDLIYIVTHTSPRKTKVHGR